MTASVVQADLQDRFGQLKDQWKAESRYLSNTAQISMLWPYQQIIGMGPAVVPLILAELLREPDHWFWALEAITGENPARPEAGGSVARMSQSWIDWGQQKGIVSNDPQP